MRRERALLGVVSMMAVAVSARAADEPRYTLHDRTLVVDAPNFHEEVPIPCDEVFGTARRGAPRGGAGPVDHRILVACGKQGLAVFLAEDPLHPRFSERVDFGVSCADVTLEGACEARYGSVAPTVTGPPAQPKMTTVHLSGTSNDVVLQAMHADGTWSTACNGSCDRPVPTAGTYRIDGLGLRASEPFSVEGAKVSLTVGAASSAAFAGGVTLLVVGILAGGVGALGLMVDGLIRLGGGLNDGSDKLLLPSALLTAGGSVAMVAGFFLMLSNNRTTVSGAGTPRLPAWRELPSTSPPRLGAVGFPLLAGTF